MTNSTPLFTRHGSCGSDDTDAMAESTAEAENSIVVINDDMETVKPARVVGGHLVYKGKMKVGKNHIKAVCKIATFTKPPSECPEVAVEGLSEDYDGLFGEITEHDVCTTVKLEGSMKQSSGGREHVEAGLTITGRVRVESYEDPDACLGELSLGEDVCTPYDHLLVKSAMLISTLSGNCASYVVEDLRRLLYLRNGKISRNRLLGSRREACRSLARLACLRKALAEVEEQGRSFVNGPPSDALLELEANLGGALAYRSSDGKHPAVYIKIASLFPTSLYLQVTPAEFQKALLKVFDCVWDKLADASRSHGEKISHVAVVLDFSGMSQLDIAAYSTHRLLGDIEEVLRAYCPWLVYKLVVYKFQFAKDLLWELFRPALLPDCRVVTAESDEELIGEIQPDGPFVLHTLGFFNESSVLRCRRPAYRLRYPPQPDGSSEWFGKGTSTRFWDEMKALYEEAPWAAPEPDPVEIVELREPGDLGAAVRQCHQKKRDDTLASKYNEVEEFTIQKECLVPHFNRALKEVFNVQDGTGLPAEIPGPLSPPEENRTRPFVDMRYVTRSDIRVCMWKPPKDAAEAAERTAQMLLKTLEKRRQWTRPPLLPNFMNAFERITYSLDCVCHGTPRMTMAATKSRLGIPPLATEVDRPAVVSSTSVEGLKNFL